MFRYLLFDLDGTILDTNELILTSFEHTLQQCLNYDVQRSELMKIFGEPLRKQMAYFCPERVDELCQAYRDFYAEHASKLTKTFPGVKETLAQLQREQIPMGVVTNKYRAPTEIALQEFGLMPHIDYIVSGDEVKNAKPHPEAILRAMELMNARPENILMVGDSPLDLEAAHRAGIQAALVRWNIFPPERFAEIKPDFCLEHMSDLIQLFELDVA